MKKKIVVALLTACMSASALQGGQYVRANNHGKTQKVELDKENAEGRFGEGLFWKVADDTLTISGKGRMPDFDGEIESPWKRFQSSKEEVSFTKVIIQEGVTHVGARTFMYDGHVTEVALPESLESIGMDAFRGTDIENVKIPSSLKEIGEDVFSECYNLKNVTIEDGVSVIGKGMFRKCYNITEITIPESVKKIEDRAFECETIWQKDKKLHLIFEGDAPIWEGSYNAEDIVIHYLSEKKGWSAPGWHGYAAVSDQSEQKGTWKKSDLGWQYRHEDGSCTKNAWEKIHDKWYHFDKKGYMQTGWMEKDGKWYYFNPSGRACANQWQWINGKCYYFHNDGHMAEKEWILNSLNRYYVDASGAWVKDTWQKNSTGWWYRHGDGSYTKNGWEKINGSMFYFANNGYMQTGRVQDNEKTYYMNDAGYMVKNQWKWIEDKCYYFGENGEMAVNMSINGSFVDASGAWVKDTWQKNSAGWWYRYGDGSYPKQQWKKINGKWYYFDELGYMFSEKWIKHTDGKWYYFGKNGSMQTGWAKDNGTWYYLNENGVMQTGWKKINNRWYLLDGNGAMHKGWAEFGEKRYYLKESGEMAVGWYTVDDQKYFFKKDGRCEATMEERSRKILDQIGWNLKSVYYYSTRQIPYKVGASNPGISIDYYAKKGFDEKCGNCYVRAALMYHMAKQLGYECNQIGGAIQGIGRNWPHSWVEVYINGQTYILDGTFEHGRDGRPSGRGSGYLLQYGARGTWKYIRNVVMKR